jgi:phytoene dehydrogenase-like protein
MTRHAANRDAQVWPMPPLGVWSSEADRHQAIIVGAGIGGLTAGALLAARGLKVLLVEAHNRPGGYCSCWTRTSAGGGSFRFDAGVQDFSGLGERGPIRHLLRALDAEQRIEWRRVRHLYQKDGLGFQVPDDPAEIVAALAALFPSERAGIAAFFHEMAAVYRELYADIESTEGVSMPPATLQGMLNWPATHPHAWRWMKRPFSEMLDTFLVDPRLTDLLTTVADYVTDRADTLSVADMAPLFGYYFDGGAYPVGGSQRLADLLCDIIAEHGGRVLLRTRIKRILVENGRAAGVETAIGRVHRAPVVVANGDVVSMLTDLVGEQHLTARYLEKLRTMRRGPSAILLSLGLNRVPDLPARIFVRQDGLGFGIGNPSVIDPTLAPPGCAALTLLCLLSDEAALAWRRRNSGYREDKDRFADRLIAAAEASVLPGLRRSIVHREVASPPTFALFARTRNGNIYGAARGRWHPRVKSPVPGLLLVGAGTSTGPGIEAVVVSGTAAANLVTRHEPRPLQPGGFVYDLGRTQ